MTDADKAALRQKAKAELKRLETYESTVYKGLHRVGI